MSLVSIKADKRTHKGRAAVPTLRLFPRFRLIQDDRGDVGESFRSLASCGAPVGPRMSKFPLLSEKFA